jgi:hypothetical protein
MLSPGWRRRSRKAQHKMKQVQTAAHMVTEAAENGGPMKFARIGMMQAINRHHVEEFDTSRKKPPWGKRKLNATNAGVRLGSNWRQLKNRTRRF